MLSSDFFSLMKQLCYGQSVYVLSIYSLIVFYCLEKYYDEPTFLLYESQLQLLCYQQTSFKIKSFQSQKYQHSTINALLHTLLNHRVFIFIKKPRYQWLPLFLNNCHVRTFQRWIYLLKVSSIDIYLVFNVNSFSIAPLLSSSLRKNLMNRKINTFYAYS